MSGIDVGTSLDTNKLKFGISGEPTWTYGTTKTLIASGAANPISGVTVLPGHRVYLYGFRITCEESNVFNICFNDGATSPYTYIRYILPSSGTVLFTDRVYLGYADSDYSTSGYGIWVHAEDHYKSHLAKYTVDLYTVSEENS
jgi:hypothetical protein